MDPFDPRGQDNRAVLIGVSTYMSGEGHPDLDDLPGVRHNLAELRKVLTDAMVGVLEDAQIVCHER